MVQSTYVDEADSVSILDSPAPVLLRKDLKEAASSLSIPEVRFLVDNYYQFQEHRIAAANQVRALTVSGEPHACLTWTRNSMFGLEKDVQAVLDAYTRSEPTGIGVWVRKIVGIGPVLAAGLLSHIDIQKAPTVGHIWRFAGLDPTSVWLGREGAKKLVQEVVGLASVSITSEHLLDLAEKAGRRFETVVKMATSEDNPDVFSRSSLEAGLARRPWNAKLKVLMFKCGDSFIKFMNHPRGLYGRLYVVRKKYEQKKNDRGDYAEQAALYLSKHKFGSDTVARKSYEEGKLPPGHIHARCRRFAAKIFLSHLHAEMYRRYHGVEPPAPFAIAFLGHTHMIRPDDMSSVDLEKLGYGLDPDEDDVDHDTTPAE